VTIPRRNLRARPSKSRSRLLEKVVSQRAVRRLLLGLRDIPWNFSIRVPAVHRLLLVTVVAARATVLPAWADTTARISTHPCFLSRMDRHSSILRCSVRWMAWLRSHIPVTMPCSRFPSFYHSQSNSFLLSIIITRFFHITPGESSLVSRLLCGRLRGCYSRKRLGKGQPDI
jgi:hypothetical protein